MRTTVAVLCILFSATIATAQVQLTPQSTTIPPGGGTLTVDCVLINPTANQVPFYLWNTIVDPYGTRHMMWGPVYMMATPYMNVTVQFSYQIPGVAPSGTYTFETKVAVPAVSPPLVFSDSFVFLK